MRRLLFPLALLAGATIVGVGLGLLLSSRDDGVGASSQPRSSLAIVSAEVEPPVHPFGEPIVAEIVLVADRSRMRPESIRIDAEFAPYETAGPAQLERTDSGSTVRLSYRYPLVCLREGCAPGGPRRSFEFPLTNVVYRFQPAAGLEGSGAGGGRATAVIDWPPFEVTARVGEAALAERSWRADVSSLPAVTYRWAPGTLAAVLFAGSVAFAVLGVGIAWRIARRREPELREAELDAAPVLIPLERALALAREASADGDSPERRRALERVARELGGRGLIDLADRARALAWAAGPPNPVALDELARDARAATAGGPR